MAVHTLCFLKDKRNGHQVGLMGRVLGPSLSLLPGPALPFVEGAAGSLGKGVTMSLSDNVPVHGSGCLQEERIVKGKLLVSTPGPAGHRLAMGEHLTPHSRWKGVG